MGQPASDVVEAPALAVVMEEEVNVDTIERSKVSRVARPGDGHNRPLGWITRFLITIIPQG